MLGAVNMSDVLDVVPDVGKSQDNGANDEDNLTKFAIETSRLVGPESDVRSVVPAEIEGKDNIATHEKIPTKNAVETDQLGGPEDDELHVDPV